MTDLRLDIHGVAVRLVAERDELLRPLRRDFEFFGAPAARGTAADVELFLLEPGAPPRARGGLLTLRTAEFSAYDRGRLREIRYRDGSTAVYDYALRRGSLHSPDPSRMHELAYLAVLSRAGEILDRRGFHRVHALGFERDGAAGLLLLPTGGGKSVLALEAVRSSGLGILSDDTPVLGPGGRVHAFPIRWAFLPSADLSSVDPALIRPFHRRRHGLKRLVDVGHFRHRVRSDLPLRWLLLGRRSAHGPPRIEPAPRAAAAAALGLHLVVGVGVAQLTEYMIRPSPREALSLARIAASRSGRALQVLAAARPHRFRLGPDPPENLRCLEDFLGSGRA